MDIKFSCINFYSKEPDKMFEFYKGLGLKVKTEGDSSSEWYGAGFTLTDFEDGPEMYIWRNTDNRVRKNEIVFHCENIHETYNTLKEKGYAVTQPELMFYGDYEMKLTDPDGNEILFLS